MNSFCRLRRASPSVTSACRRSKDRHFATASSDHEKAVENCLQMVKLHDFDSYLSGILLPKKYRGPYFAVRAFHVELAMIKDQSRGNLMSGRMRFQFWRDNLEQIFSPTESSAMQLQGQAPVPRALRHYAKEFDLPQRYFERALEARQKELVIQQHDTLDEMEDFAEQTHSSVNYILLNVYGGARDEDLCFAASHVGVCTGIVTQLRGMAQLSSQAEIVIPVGTMAKHGVGTRPILKGPKTPEEHTQLQDAVFDVASQAHGHLDEARRLVNSTSIFTTRPGFLALLPAVRCRIFLEDLRKVQFNPYHPDMLGRLQTPNQLQFQYELVKSTWTNRI